MTDDFHYSGSVHFTDKARLKEYLNYFRNKGYQVQRKRRGVFIDIYYRPRSRHTKRRHLN